MKEEDKSCLPYVSVHIFRSNDFVFLTKIGINIVWLFSSATAEQLRSIYQSRFKLVKEVYRLAYNNLSNEIEKITKDVKSTSFRLVSDYFTPPEAWLEKIAIDERSLQEKILRRLAYLLGNNILPDAMAEILVAHLLKAIKENFANQEKNQAFGEMLCNYVVEEFKQKNHHNNSCFFIFNLLQATFQEHCYNVSVIRVLILKRFSLDFIFQYLTDPKHEAAKKDFIGLEFLKKRWQKNGIGREEYRFFITKLNGLKRNIYALQPPPTTYKSAIGRCQS